jgi:hypothetical protein
MATGSRIDKALRILRLDAEATAETMAEALWLANVLPVEEQAEATPNADAGGAAKATPAADPPESGPGPVVRPTAPASSSASSTVGLYPRLAVNPDDAFIPATFITVPAADALPNRLAIERALKPFLKRFPSKTLQQLDGDATAEKSADRRNITPVFVPLPERWFDVLLLVERSDAMEIWADTVRDLQVLLGRHGAFRRVRVLRFAARGGTVVLYTAAGQPLAPHAAADPEGRRLCLFLTNGTSVEWRRRTLVDFVRTLGRRTVVAILQMLPPRLWSQTALGDALEQVQTPAPASPNASLRREDAFTGLERVADASCVPVLTLDPAQVDRWARFVISPRRVIHPAIFLNADAEAGASTAASASATANDGMQPAAPQRLAAFRASASKGALQLLRVLAGVPLTLPIMKLVQQSASTSREQSQLAEVMLSSLIERVTPADARVPPEQVFYDFIPGVRETLLGTLASHELDALDTAMHPAQEKLRTFVERQTGSAIRDFRALLADPEGMERLPASARSFVEVSRRIYEARGVLPTSVPNEPRPFEISPRILMGEGRVIATAISGRGRYVGALMDRERRWAQIWNRETGMLIRELAFQEKADVQLLAPGGTDDIFALSDGVATNLAPGPGVQMRIQLDKDASAFAIMPSGKGLAAVTHERIRFRDASTGKITLELPRAGTEATRALAVAGKTVIEGFDSGAVHVSISLDDLDQEWRQQDNVTWSSFSFPGAIAALSIANDGQLALILTRTGFVSYWKKSAQPETTALPIVDATSISLTGDGVFAAVGHRSGTVSIWDLSRITRVLELRQGDKPVLSVSLSGAGDYAASASEEGLKWWDLGAFMTAARRLVQRRARVARTVSISVQEGRENLAQEIIDALRKAGHIVREKIDANSDYIVLVSSIRNPYLSDALMVYSFEQLPWLLDELDLNPPGKLINLPREVQEAVARPQLEADLARYLIAEATAPFAYIRSQPFSGVAVSLRNVVIRDEVRRGFPGGIYWDAQRPPDSPVGTALVVHSTGQPPEPRPGTLLLLAIEEDPALLLAHVFEFPLLSRDDADRHLRAAGMPDEEVTVAAVFHGGYPLLVSLTAGVFRQGLVPASLPGGILETKFDRIALAAIQTLSETARRDLIRFSARLGSPDPQPEESALQFARKCGWVLALGNDFLMIKMARECIARHFAEEMAAAHEYYCVLLEAPGDGFRGAGIEHAYRAGGADRVERFLRNRSVLKSYLLYSRVELVQQLLPFAKENAFLNAICAIGAQNPMMSGWGAGWGPLLLDSLLAPRPQWPESSGVASAQAQSFRGEGIRILVPGTGCNPAHPEFAGRPFPPGTSDAATYGTSVCSVIAGNYIGVAPAAIVQPLAVLGRDLRGSAADLVSAFGPMLEEPIDIVCFTLAFPDDSTQRALHELIQRLVARGVLVIAAAGNEGVDHFSVPGIYPEVLSVGYCDFDGNVVEHSSRGVYSKVSPPRTVPDLYGYGQKVNIADGEEGYSQGSGSTFAAAYVAGIAALYANALQIRGEELKQLLLRTADPTTRVARFGLATAA